LSKLELELCQKIQLLPYAFIALKDALIREAFRSGMLTKDGVQRILRLDPERNSIIYDFFVTNLDVNGSQDRNRDEMSALIGQTVSSSDYIGSESVDDFRRGPGRPLKRKL
jgi:hypothetical protein